MFNRDGKLDIFENFRVDRSLPKYTNRPRKPKFGKSSKFSSNQDDMSDDEESALMDSISVGNVRNIRSPRWDDPKNQSLVTWMEEGILPWPWRWVRRLQRLWAWMRGRPSQGKTLTIQEFFRSLKNSADELKVVDERAKGYEAALSKARAAGQVALCETLELGLQSMRAEAQLVALGLVKYLDEEKVVEFVKRAKRGLRLDWVANFGRVIPDAVMDAKKRADERQVFDNYVVLHYDPDKKSWVETNAEMAARRDPILFGVLTGKRRLYYIGDWVDEYCDLTLDQIADTLGKEAVKELT